jgi:hypothetical protein
MPTTVIGPGQPCPACGQGYGLHAPACRLVAIEPLHPADDVRAMIRSLHALLDERLPPLARPWQAVLSDLAIAQRQTRDRKVECDLLAEANAHMRFERDQLREDVARLRTAAIAAAETDCIHAAERERLVAANAELEVAAQKSIEANLCIGELKQEVLKRGQLLAMRAPPTMIPPCAACGEPPAACICPKPSPEAERWATDHLQERNRVLAAENERLKAELARRTHPW